MFASLDSAYFPTRTKRKVLHYSRREFISREKISVKFVGDSRIGEIQEEVPRMFKFLQKRHSWPSHDNCRRLSPLTPRSLNMECLTTSSRNSFTKDPRKVVFKSSSFQSYFDSVPIDMGRHQDCSICHSLLRVPYVTDHLLRECPIFHTA